MGAPLAADRRAARPSLDDIFDHQLREGTVPGAGTTAYEEKHGQRR